MKNIVLLTALAISTSVYAGDNVTADSNLAIGANTILAKFTRVTEVPASETPNVDKSLAIGARTILGIFPRLTQVSESEKASVDSSKNAFVRDVMNRGAAQYNQAHSVVVSQK